MALCADCVWFDAPADAYLGLCALFGCGTACNHGCAKFVGLLPPPEAAAPIAVPSLLVRHGGCVVRKCGSCGSLNMGPQRCNACQLPWA